MIKILLLVAVLCAYQASAYFDTCWAGVHSFVNYEKRWAPVAFHFIDNSRYSHVDDLGYDGIGDGSGFMFREGQRCSHANEKSKAFRFPLKHECAVGVTNALAPVYDGRNYRMMSCAGKFLFGGLTRDLKNSQCYYNDPTTDDVHRVLSAHKDDGVCCWHFVEDFTRLACWTLHRFPECREDLDSAHIKGDETYWLTKAAQKSGEHWDTVDVGAEDMSIIGNNVWNSLKSMSLPGSSDLDQLLFQVAPQTEMCMRTAIGWSRLDATADLFVRSVIHNLPFFMTFQHLVDGVIDCFQGNWTGALAHLGDGAVHFAVDALGGSVLKATVSVAAEVVHNVDKLTAVGLMLPKLLPRGYLSLQQLSNTEPCVACMLSDTDMITLETGLTDQILSRAGSKEDFVNEYGSKTSLCGYLIDVDTVDSLHSVQARLASQYLIASERKTHMKKNINALKNVFLLNVFTASVKAYQAHVDEQTVKELDQKLREVENLALKMNTEASDYQDQMASLESGSIADGKAIELATERLEGMYRGAVGFEAVIKGKASIFTGIRTSIARDLLGWTAADATRLSKSVLADFSRLSTEIGRQSGRASRASAGAFTRLSGGSLLQHAGKTSDDEEDDSEGVPDWALINEEVIEQQMQAVEESGSATEPSVANVQLINQDWKCLAYSDNSFSLEECNNKTDGQQVFNMYNLENLFLSVIGVDKQVVIYDQHQKKFSLVSPKDSSVSASSAVGVIGTSGFLTSNNGSTILNGDAELVAVGKSATEEETASFPFFSIVEAGKVEEGREAVEQSQD